MQFLDSLVVRFKSLSRRTQVLLILAGIVVAVIASPLFYLIAGLIFGVGVLILIVQALRRRPLRRWVWFTLIALISAVVFGVVASAVYEFPGSSRQESTVSSGKSSPEPTTNQPTKAPPEPTTSQPAKAPPEPTTSQPETTTSAEPASSSQKWIPGFHAVDITMNLEDKRFKCDRTRQADPNVKDSDQGYIWYCKSPGSGDRTVTVYGQSESQVDMVEVAAFVDQADPVNANLSDKDATDLLALIATMPYDDAKPQEAKQWVNDNIDSLGQGVTKTTQIGSAKFELVGQPGSDYFLSIYAPVIDE